MDETFGKLVLLEEERGGREFELSKASITLGRGLANDIVLADVRVSRNHARLECDSSGCRILDLGSSNGTQLNGHDIIQADLKRGDVISLGSSRLRYLVSPLAEDLAMTRLDSEGDIQLTLSQEILPMTINETDTPRLVVFTQEGTREVSLEDVERITVGRTDESDLTLVEDRVSRRHAEVLRKGDNWILRDLGSTNGTWLHGERIEQVALQPNDVVRIGGAQVVFKDGTSSETRDRLDETVARMSVRRPVVFVPGLMGSSMWLGNERVWPSVKTLLTNPELFRYPSDLPFEARGVVDELVIVPNLIKQDQYNRLGDYLVEELGYVRGKDFFEFAYDWRQDVRQSARQLAESIERLPATQPITIIAHSLGTLVSRYYIERLGGKERVERAMLMGGPHLGTVKAMTSLLIAPAVLPFGLLGERLRRVMATFPSSYQILPTYTCAVDQNGGVINFLEDKSWLSEEYVPLLRAAQEFRRELGTHSSVPAISIFGYGLKTVSSISLRRSLTGELSDIAYQSALSGDSSVPERSAVLPETEIHPVQQYHGSLFVDSDVRMRLKLELTKP